MTAHAARHGTTAMIVALAICGVAAQSVAADGLDARPASSGSKAEFARPVSDSPQLRANVSNTERYIVKGVCEGQGVRQISQILKRSEFEEMWAFLLRAHGTQDCQWHEIGRGEKSEKDSAHVRVDTAYLKTLMAANMELYVYHFHPLKYFECASHADCAGATAWGQPGSFDRRWIADLVYSMPSPSDVHFMMDVTSSWTRLHRGLGTIRHKVVTPYGVVEYELTGKGLARFEAERFGRSEGLYIMWVAASRLADDHVERVIKERPGSIIAAVRRLAQTLNSEFLGVSYSAFAWESEQSLARAQFDNRETLDGGTGRSEE
jgi:hypothetical protein